MLSEMRARTSIPLVAVKVNAENAELSYRKTAWHNRNPVRSKAASFLWNFWKKALVWLARLKFEAI